MSPTVISEAPGFIQVYSDNTVKRFSHKIATPSPDTYHENTIYKYKSKDVIIDQSKHITARIFLPQIESPSSSSPSLPLLLYFHGGGFCIGSTTWLGYHAFLGDLSATAKIVIVSVDYRLAPENKLPIAYDDCFATLEWVKSRPDKWLLHADLSSVFLCGDSAGGNIAHQVAIRAVKCCSEVDLRGIVLIHPYFGSEARTELEMDEEFSNEVAMNDMFWELSLPEGSDRDFYGCNFEKQGFDEWRLFPRVLVFVAERDFLKERGVMYAEFLERKGLQERVSLVETEGESHVFHVWNPESEATRVLQEQITGFIHGV